MNWRQRGARAVLYFEGLITIGTGAVAMARPSALLGSLTADALDAAALDILPQLGVAWIVIGMLVLSLPRISDARTLRLVMAPILCGDALHVIALFPWQAHDITALALGFVFFVNRALIAWRPAGFLAGSDLA